MIEKSEENRERLKVLVEYIRDNNKEISLANFEIIHMVHAKYISIVIVKDLISTSCYRLFRSWDAEKFKVYGDIHVVKDKRISLNIAQIYSLMEKGLL